MVKNLPANAGDMGVIPKSEKTPLAGPKPMRRNY